MKALTLIRPWDQAIVRGPKRVENRDWKPPAALLKPGERLAIHAGRKWDAGFDAYNSEWTPPTESECPSGVVVGVATLDAVHDVKGCDVCMTCAICNDPWTVGDFGWVLKGVVALAEPVPCRGAQGLWTLPPEVAARVLAQVAGGPS